MSKRKNETAEQYSERRREYTQANLDKIHAYQRQWYRSNKARNMERVRKWRARNRKAFLAYHREYNAKYYQAHREALLESRRQRYAAMKTAGTI